MPKSKVRYVGLDVHKDAMVMAVAERGRDEACEAASNASITQDSPPSNHKHSPICTLPTLCDAVQDSFAIVSH